MARFPEDLYHRIEDNPYVFLTASFTGILTSLACSYAILSHFNDNFVQNSIFITVLTALMALAVSAFIISSSIFIKRDFFDKHKGQVKTYIYMYSGAFIILIILFISIGSLSKPGGQNVSPAINYSTVNYINGTKIPTPTIAPYLSVLVTAQSTSLTIGDSNTYYGTVNDQNNDPVPGATLVIIDDFNNGATNTITTDASGKFSWSNKYSDTGYRSVTFIATKTGYMEGKNSSDVWVKPFSLCIIVTATSTSIKPEFWNSGPNYVYVNTGGSITYIGSVHDQNDKPMPGVTVSITDGTNNGAADTVTTDNSGNFSWSNKPPYGGEITFEAIKNGYEDDNIILTIYVDQYSVNIQVVTSVAMGKYMENINVNNGAPITYSGNVQDEHRNPVTGAKVLITDGTNNGVTHTVTTDSSGGFTWSNKPMNTGKIMFLSSKTGYPNGKTSIQVTVKNYSLRISVEASSNSINPGGSVTYSGTVHDEHYMPLARVIVSITDDTNGGVTDTVTTDAFGGFTWQNKPVKSGSVWFKVSKNGYDSDQTTSRIIVN